jgi:putative serine protease PepD
MNFKSGLVRRAAAVSSATALAAVLGGGAMALRPNRADSLPATTTTVATTAARQASDVSIAGDSAASVYKAASPGVVEITVATTNAFGGRQSSGQGSGFVIDTAGHIVTNAHVVEGASSLTVTFADGSTATAKIVGTDRSTDLALLSIDAAAAKLHPLTLAGTAGVEVGDPVLAIGSPFGLAGSLTEGIVSALDREIRSPDGTTFGHAVQTDAAINPGNSGGPLLDTDGDVIGVNAQIDSAGGGNDGVGFSIPSYTVKTFVASLLGAPGT